MKHASGINPEAVRSYDLRGKVGEEITTRDAMALGMAYATVARRAGMRAIAVGRDGRESSQELEDALIEGLVAGGMHVRRIGLGPTPQLYFAMQALALDGGIMVTGSHNPPAENGFKLVLGHEPVHGAALRRLVATRARTAAPGSREQVHVASEYVEHLASEVRRCRPRKVVWDCGNGAVGALIQELTQQIPGEHVLLNARVDGRFPAHHPDPAVAANLQQLQQAVRAHGADLGIAFDGDGDRIGVVDGTGVIVWPDQLLLLLAEELLPTRPGAAIVADVKSSRVLFEGIERLGGRPVMSPSGYVLVRAAMLEQHAPLAGEMSGHIILADGWCRVDDALYIAMRTLAALDHREGTLADFRNSLPRTAATPEIRLSCPQRRKRAVTAEVARRLVGSGARVDTTDGLRVTRAEGWWLLRASGTEPKLAVRCEAHDASGLEQLCSELADHLRESGVDPGALQQSRLL